MYTVYRHLIILMKM